MGFEPGESGEAKLAHATSVVHSSVSFEPGESGEAKLAHATSVVHSSSRGPAGSPQSAGSGLLSRHEGSTQRPPRHASKVGLLEGSGPMAPRRSRPMGSVTTKFEHGVRRVRRSPTTAPSSTSQTVTS